MVCELHGVGNKTKGRIWYVNCTVSETNPITNMVCELHGVGNKNNNRIWPVNYTVSEACLEIMPYCCGIIYNVFIVF